MSSNFYRGLVVRTLATPQGAPVYVSRTVKCDPPAWMVTHGDHHGDDIVTGRLSKYAPDDVWEIVAKEQAQQPTVDVASLLLGRLVAIDPDAAAEQLARLRLIHAEREE